MVVRNITTSIKSEKTLMEIEGILAKFGARGIYKEFDSEGNVNLLMFYIVHKGQKIPFKMPMNIEKARKIIKLAVDERKLQRKFLEEPLRTEKAYMVGWRIIKDWIHSQMSLLEMEFAEPLQIFLSYAYNPVEDKTMYEKFEENKDKFLALENSSHSKDYVAVEDKK